jgi:hypothetical protein
MERSLKPLCNKIRSISGGSAPELVWNEYEKAIFLQSNPDNRLTFSEDPSVIRCALDRLVESGHIRYATNEHHFCLTFKGMHPYQVGWEAVKAFIMRSIATPIFVAFVTAILTSYIYNKHF